MSTIFNGLATRTKTLKRVEEEHKLEPKIDIDIEFKSLKELKEFLNKLPDEILDKELQNDGIHDGLRLYEDQEEPSVYYL